MFYRIKRALVWLRRARYSRGFGVQSPWAYRFIRYVVNEHYPYYEYTHLNKEVYGLTKVVRKLCRLYFRIANYVQPKLIVDYGAGTTAYRSYFKAGCRSSEVVQISSDDKGMTKLTELLDSGKNSGKGRTAYQKQFGNSTIINVARISLKGDYRKAVDEMMNHTNRSSLFIIQHIKKNHTTQQYWDELIADERVGVTFDLYYCGILFFDKKIYKKNYLVNF